MTNQSNQRPAKNNQTTRTPERRGQQPQARQKPALTRRDNNLHNNPFKTPELQARLRSLKRAEYTSKSREDLSPSHTFPPCLAPIHSIGQPGAHHINTARWSEDDLSRVFSLANSIPFHFEPIGLQLSSLFHLYAFLFAGGRQVTTLMIRDAAALDSLVRGKPGVMVNRFAIFAYAVYQKISQTPDLKAIAQSTTAPFDYYILARERREAPATRRRIYESGIISAAFEEARKAVKNDTFPNLVPFFDLDYQLNLEEITDQEERVKYMLDLIEEACAPIREKAKKVEENMKQAPKRKADKQQPADASVINSPESQEVVQQAVEAIKAAPSEGEASTEAPTSGTVNAAPTDIQLGTQDNAGLVLVLDDFTSAPLVTTVG